MTVATSSGSEVAPPEVAPPEVAPPDAPTGSGPPDRTIDDQHLTQALEEDVRAVLRALRGTNVQELRLAWGDVRITLRRDLDAGQTAAAPALPQQDATPAAPAGPLTTEVRAHMVGPFHRARESEGPALSTEGERVEAGGAVGVIETLGMATDVEAPAAGVLERFLVEDGQPVEFGQVVAIILPES